MCGRKSRTTAVGRTPHKPGAQRPGVLFLAVIERGGKPVVRVPGPGGKPWFLPVRDRAPLTGSAWLPSEQALRERFLPFYGGTVTFVDGQGREHEVTPGRFSDLFDRDNPLVKSSWRLKLLSGRRPIRFNGMLASLLQWAREERLLG